MDTHSVISMDKNGTTRPPQSANLNIAQKKKSTQNIRVATINVRTLHDDIKLALIIKAAEKLRIDILALQETRRTGNGAFIFDDESLKGWQLVWTGHKRKREHGTGILLAPHVKLDDHTEHLQARIVSAYVCVHGVRFAILNIYSPTDCTESESAKASFYAALTKAKLELDKTSKYKPIILGDWNATISSESKSSGAWDYILGHNNSDRVQTNGNGERMLAWCSKHRMKIMNTLFRTKRIHRGTWRHPATGKWKRIDYICTSKWISKFVQSCRVYIGPSALFDTDHRLLVMNMSFPATKQQLKFSVNRSNKNIPAPSTVHSILRISVEHRQKLTDELERELDEVCQIDEVNELNEKITTSVIACAEKVCPKANHVKKKELWDDDELLNEMKNLSKCKNDKEIRKQQKNIKKRRNKLMNDYYQELANDINTVAEARDTNMEFALAHKYS